MKISVLISYFQGRFYLQQKEKKKKKKPLIFNDIKKFTQYFKKKTKANLQESPQNPGTLKTNQ